ncbi:MAG: hypothetical protein HKN58_06360 [Xanthomonadales bacterium]|nr:hypothetical protein [Xanthomonadales bacterium]
MQNCRFPSPRTRLLSVVFLLFTSTAFADHLVISRYFSGAWVHPGHESQGLVLHIADAEDDEKVGVAHWFTFGDDLQTAWFVAVGPVNGHEINMTLFTASGIGFMDGEVVADAMVEEIGTLDLSFRNCNHGTAAFETSEEAIGSGEFDIRRLTSLYRSRCSGGISDDTPSDRRPTKLSVRLLPARDDISGGGKAQFWERPDRSDFKVRAEGMPDGVYDLLVCAADIGDMEVVAGEGELEYRSPGIDSKLLLDFDPRDCPIELVDGLGVALSSGDAVLAPHEPGGHQGDDVAGIVIEVDFVNTGVAPGASGKAKFETHGDQTGFSVEIEDLPAGLYPLLVAGDQKGQIEVVEDGGQFKGKLKFSNPVGDGSVLLDFDPRGAIVEVLQGDAVILESLFPEE